MASRVQRSSAAVSRPLPSNHPLAGEDGLSTKKTALVIVTVVGCIAILWPKVFYPAMFGGSGAVDAALKSTTHRGDLQRRSNTGSGCCEVVLNREEFYNITSKKTFGGPGESSSSVSFRTDQYPSDSGVSPFPASEFKFRKNINMYTDEIIGLRQERPVHLHPESVYQAMRERGRAIPAAPTLPSFGRRIPASSRPSVTAGLHSAPSPSATKIIDGKPGPIPGMRPPMGGGSMHQPQTKGSSMGIIMPLYTVGIVVFFGYTIMKIVFKKPMANAPYGPAVADNSFRKEVFGPETDRPSQGSSKLGTNRMQTNKVQSAGNNKTSKNSEPSAAAIAEQFLQQEKRKKRSLPVIEVQQELQRKDLSVKEYTQLMEIDQLRRKLEETEKAMEKLIAELNSDQYEAKKTTKYREQNSKAELAKDSTFFDNNRRKLRENSADRTVAVLGMEMTASCEGGQKWSSRPPTPVLSSHHEHSKHLDDEAPKKTPPHSIYLEGTLTPESQLLVSDSETKQEKVYNEDLDGSFDEPAVIVSSKMTLSLINLDQDLLVKQRTDHLELESPLADDIEIISHDEHEK